MKHLPADSFLFSAHKLNSSVFLFIFFSPVFCPVMSLSLFFHYYFSFPSSTCQFFWWFIWLLSNNTSRETHHLNDQKMPGSADDRAPQVWQHALSYITWFTWIDAERFCYWWDDVSTSHYLLLNLNVSNGTEPGSFITDILLHRRKWDRLFVLLPR